MHYSLVINCLSYNNREPLRSRKNSISDDNHDSDNDNSDNLNLDDDNHDDNDDYEIIHY